MQRCNDHNPSPSFPQSLASVLPSSLQPERTSSEDSEDATYFTDSTPRSARKSQGESSSVLSTKSVKAEGNMEDGEIPDAQGVLEGAAAENMEGLDMAMAMNTDSDIASSGPHSPIPEDSELLDTCIISEAPPPSSPTSPEHHQQQNDMTEDQMYQAKVVVLDLLGWGVTPEYILDRGVSHKLLHTVFSELNLRLPESIAADYATVVNGTKDG